MTSLKGPKWISSLAISAFVALILWLIRLGIPYTFDDTASIVVVRLTALAHPNGLFTILGNLRDVWKDSRAIYEYRPINSLQVISEILFFGDDPLVPSLFQSLITGGAAAFIYLISLEFFSTPLVGLGAALLFAFSVPDLMNLAK
jgi:hypothetical protein